MDPPGCEVHLLLLPPFGTVHTRPNSSQLPNSVCQLDELESSSPALHPFHQEPFQCVSYSLLSPIVHRTFMASHPASPSLLIAAASPNKENSPSDRKPFEFDRQQACLPGRRLYLPQPSRMRPPVQAAKDPFQVFTTSNCLTLSPQVAL